jgi:hypothetical protein
MLSSPGLAVLPQPAVLPGPWPPVVYYQTGPEQESTSGRTVLVSGQMTVDSYAGDLLLDRIPGRQDRQHDRNGPSAQARARPAQRGGSQPRRTRRAGDPAPAHPRPAGPGAARRHGDVRGASTARGRTPALRVLTFTVPPNLGHEADGMTALREPPAIPRESGRHLPGPAGVDLGEVGGPGAGMRRCRELTELAELVEAAHPL